MSIQALKIILWIHEAHCFYIWYVAVPTKSCQSSPCGPNWLRSVDQEFPYTYDAKNCKKNLLGWSHAALSLYIYYVAMSSGTLYKTNWPCSGYQEFPYTYDAKNCKNLLWNHEAHSLYIWYVAKSKWVWPEIQQSHTADQPTVYLSPTQIHPIKPLGPIWVPPRRSRFYIELSRKYF